MHFYETARLDIPVFLHEHQRKEISDKSLEVEAYVDEHLAVKPGAKSSYSAISSTTSGS